MTGRKPKGKREPKPKAKPKAKATTRYDELAAQWESQQNDPDRGGGDWLVDKPDLPVDAAPLLATLRRLGYVTQEQRYFDLHRDLMRSGMIDRATGKWSRYGTALAHPDAQWLCEQMEQYIAEGVPAREVFAEVAVEFGITATSFVAAVEQVRALLHAHRKSV